MKTLLSFLLFLPMVSATYAAPVDLVESDGLAFTKGWQVEDGVISPSDKPGGYLWSKKSYTNFIVSVEYKTTAKCNSGLFFRTDPKNAVQGGFEIQIASPGLYGGKHIVGSLYDAKEPSSAAGKPDGEWNQMILTCEGSSVIVSLNGIEIQNLDLSDWTSAQKNPDGSKNKFKTPLKDLPQHGRIGFQYHGQPVFFRNILVTEQP